MAACCSRARSAGEQFVFRMKRKAPPGRSPAAPLFMHAGTHFVRTCPFSRQGLLRYTEIPAALIDDNKAREHDRKKIVAYRTLHEE